MDIGGLVNITARSWALTILKLMHAGVPGRQAPLLAASGASRTSFANSLAYLVDQGLLERNPGHGHPLRPEYRLTARGAQYGRLGAAIGDALDGAEAPVLLRRTWTIPILAVSGAPRRFADIKDDLAAITDRALAQSLRNLEAQRWMARTVDMDTTRPIYQAANAGAAISDAVNRLI